MLAILTRFDLNRRNVAAFAISPPVHSLVRRHAQVAKTYAETLAEAQVPANTDKLEDPDHIHYHQAFRLRFGVVSRITQDWPMMRAAARLTNIAPHARFVEDGFRYWKRSHVKGDHWVTVPGKHILGQTLEYLESFDERVEVFSEVLERAMDETEAAANRLSFDQSWREYT